MLASALAGDVLRSARERRAWRQVKTCRSASGCLLPRWDCPVHRPPSARRASAPRGEAGGRESFSSPSAPFVGVRSDRPRLPNPVCSGRPVPRHYRLLRYAACAALSGANSPEAVASCENHSLRTYRPGRFSRCTKSADFPWSVAAGLWTRDDAAPSRLRLALGRRMENPPIFPDGPRRPISGAQRPGPISDC